MRRYQQMSPEQRQQLQEKRKKWQNLSPEQKKRIRDEYRKRRRNRKANSHQRRKQQ
jgi:hypothetical protein